MSVAFSIVLGFVAALLLGLALLLLTPLRLELSLQKEPTWRYRAAIRPLGRLGPRINLVRPRKTEVEAPAEKPKLPKKSRIRFQWVIPAGMAFFRDVLRSIRIRRVHVDSRFGLGDPSETGQVFGLLAPFAYGIPASPGVHIHIEPVFDNHRRLTGRVELDLSLVPAMLLAPAIRFGWRAFGPEL